VTTADSYLTVSVAAVDGGGYQLGLLPQTAGQGGPVA